MSRYRTCDPLAIGAARYTFVAVDPVFAVTVQESKTSIELMTPLPLVYASKALLGFVAVITLL